VRKKHPFHMLATTLAVCTVLVGFFAAPASAAEKKVIAVGDIANDPNGTDSQGSYQSQIDTATVVSNFSPVKMFLLGDTQYNTGEPGDYKCSLTGETTDCGSFDNNEGFTGTTWGSLDDGTAKFVEAVGNHEYFNDSGSGTDGAEGFRDYFVNETGQDHGTASVNDWTNPFFYTTTVNTSGNGGLPQDDWRIYVIDSEVCQHNSQDECQAGGSQYVELSNAIEADTVRATRDCVGVIMHHSRFSNEEDHASDTDMNDLLTLLDDRAGVDLVLSGHGHLYEKFPRQSISGTSPPTEGQGNPRWFTVGTGGTGTRSFDIGQNNNSSWDHHTSSFVPMGGSASKLYDNNTQNNAAYGGVIGGASGDHQGVLKLWLTPHQYDTQFVDENGTTIIDPVDGTGGDGQNGAAWQYACANDPAQT
jgi:acid phosphatase type 7